MREKGIQMYFKNLVYLIILLSGIVSCLFSEVGVRIDTGIVPNPHFYNTTNKSWQLGGFRFCTDNFHWATIQMTGAVMVMSERMVAGKIETEGMFHRNTQQSITKLPVTDNYMPVAWSWTTSGEAVLKDYPDEPYILIKTGSSGSPDDPEDEDPISVDQIDSLLALPDFYNAGYRWTNQLGVKYYDSLGVNGGRYSGGFMDTYLGETQILIPLDSAVFVINNTPVIFDPKGINSSIIYMMTLAMGQEYFHVDLQWQMGFGAKETFAGVSGTNSKYIGTNADGAFGCFEVELATGTDRALAYPKFFPLYAKKLANAQDVSTSGVSTSEFMGHYCGAAETAINSAWVVNSFVMSAIVQYANYDFYAYAEDICWKETLSECVDPYVGVGAMAPTYNLGINGGGALCAAILNVNNYQALLNDPLAHKKFPTGNSNYRPNILKVIQNLINAAKKSMTDLSIEMYDESISKTELIRFFYGDNGTVDKQGAGGLLHHFYIDDMSSMRKDIFNTLDEAFNELKGKSPSTKGTENISFRYDFLTILRTVKGQFDTHRDRPNGGDIVLNINKYSKIGGCSSSELDEKYPFMDFGSKEVNGSNFTLDVNATDNQNVGNVKWTTDASWVSWQDAIYISGNDKDQDYEVKISNAISGSDLWVMVTDSSGNSIVRKLLVTGSKQPLLDSTIIVDTKGDGVGDKITIHIRPVAGSGTDPISSYKNLKYSWPTQTSLIGASGNVTVNSDNLVILDDALTGGAGLGKVTFDYPSKAGYKDNIIDRVGPALHRGVAELKAKFSTSDLDTLIVNFTEPIKDNLKANTIYLNFDPSGKNMSIATIRETDSRYRFLFANGTIAKNKYVQIVHTSGICDVKGNIPLSKNQWVPIVAQSNLYKVSSGTFQDINGDGIMDKVTVTFETGIDKIKNDMSFVFEWLDNTNKLIKMTAKGSSVTLKNGVEVEWLVSSNYSLKQYLTSLGGNWGKASFIQPDPNGGGSIATDISSKMKDAMAPVIRSSAKYYSLNSTKISDTLTVEFSETVAAINSNKPFKFLDMPASSQYMIEVNEVKNTGSRVVFSVENFTNNIVPITGDSIWIYAGNGVADRKGNKQTFENNKKQPISVMCTYSILVFPNPYNPNEVNANKLSEIDKVWSDYSISGSKKHVLIVIQPNGQYPSSISITAIADIYDMVGNLIKGNIVFGKNTGDKQVWYYLWDAKNINSRNIGSNAYLCVIEVTESENGLVLDNKKHTIVIGKKSE